MASKIFDKARGKQGFNPIPPFDDNDYWNMILATIHLKDLLRKLELDKDAHTSVFIASMYVKRVFSL